jgi:hypothetical protein
MVNYLVVLFKNKRRKRIIKKFVTLKKTKPFYNNLIENSNNVIFPVEIEGGKECKYELGIVEMSAKQLVPIYMTDEFGRSVKVKLDESDMTLFEISPFKKEELIHDNQSNKKITSQELIRKYIKGSSLKMVYCLNNRIVIQEDEVINLFTTKTESESVRLIDCLSTFFFKTKRTDCLFIKDTSTPQKKYLFNLLESKGISRKILYRKFTSLVQLK